MQRLPLVFALVVCLCPLANPASSAESPQVRILSPTAVDPATSQTSLVGVLTKGEQLEKQRHWGEALTLYEDALREFPQDRALANHHVLARMHYDLGRRYGDGSFNKSVRGMSDKDALALYNEVLLKIHSHYVAEPNWQNLVQLGLQSLDVALEENPFVDKNLPRGKRGEELSSDYVTAETALRQQLHKLAESRQIRTRAEAVELVGQMQKIGKDRIGLSPTALTFEFTCGAMNSLDEYSAFLTADQLNDVYSQIEGNFVGLGIELKANGTGLLIVKVITGSPAERGGLVAGDRIVAVDGRSTSKMSTDQAANLLQGEENSVVEVAVVTSDEPARKLKLRREHVEVPSVDDVHMVDAKSGIGYLKLTCFQKTTSKDLDAALWKLQRDGMKSLIMDLRGNPGGLLTASVDIADKFLDEGTIVSTHGRSSLEDFNYTAHQAGTWHVPLVVLIDGDSASASEIFAGAIKDHRRGTVVGQKSYGKGSVQGIFPLTLAGAGVRLTTAKFFSPSGSAISRVGITPDTVVDPGAKTHIVARPVDGQISSADPVETDATLRAALTEAKSLSAFRPTSRK
jgi:carboxyl-terminal processing protease